MKFDFLKKFNAKIVTIVALAVVLAVGGGTVLAIGTSSSNRENPELSEQEAKAAAFSHAGIAEDDVLALQISKGTENGSPVYEIEFKTAEKSYDYDVVRNSGEILRSSYDVITQEKAVETKENTSSSSQTDTSSSTPSSEATKADTNPASSQATQPNSTSSAITKDKAKSIALQDAGVKESDTQFLWVKEDYEDGRAVYDVEFYANGTEYDYEIEKSSGRILNSDYDIEHYSPNNGSGNTTTISLEKARSIALAKVPGASASDVRIHLDRDDERQIYEGEIYYNRMEYEFEMDAATGNFIEWSAENWD